MLLVGNASMSDGVSSRLASKEIAHAIVHLRSNGTPARSFQKPYNKKSLKRIMFACKLHAKGKHDIQIMW